MDEKVIQMVGVAPADEVIGFLERTVEKLREGDEVPVAVVVTVMSRGRGYSNHIFGTREAGVLGMIGAMEAAKVKLLQNLEE